MISHVIGITLLFILYILSIVVIYFCGNPVYKSTQKPQESTDNKDDDGLDAI